MIISLKRYREDKDIVELNISHVSIEGIMYGKEKYIQHDTKMAKKKRVIAERKAWNDKVKRSYRVNG